MNILGTMKNIKFDKIWNGVKKASPEILVASGLLTLLSATVLAIKNAKEAYAELDEKMAMYEAEGKEMPKSEVIFTHAKHQVAPIIMSVTGAGAIIGASTIHHKRNTALALALQAGEAYVAEMETKFKKLVGKDKVEEVKSEMAEKKQALNAFVGETQLVRIRDSFIGCEFLGTVAGVNRARDEVNKMLVNGECISAHVFYELLGEECGQTSANKLIGWTANDKYGGFLLDLNWYAELDGDIPIAVFEYEQEPSTDFWGASELCNRIH